jgi:DsbC/DsbD-like thiol-disulfide interchange protein
VHTLLTRLTAVLVGLLLSTGTIADAQARRPVAEVATKVDTKAIRGGATVRLVAHVRLPAGIHVQSNKPRDPDLIATELSLTLPKGMTLVDVVYPKASDFVIPGFKQPLAVYPNEFDIVVRVKLDARMAAGALTLPAALRYQACNDTVCFAPARAAMTWTMQVARS